MKSLKVILAVASGLLIGAVPIHIFGQLGTSNVLIKSALFFVVGFAASFWGKPLTWKHLVFFQIPFVAFIVWQLTCLVPLLDAPVGRVWGWAAAWILLMVATSIIEARLRRVPVGPGR